MQIRSASCRSKGSCRETRKVGPLALAKGLIPKTERISYVGMHLANKRRSQGQPVQRISGKPYLDHVSKEHAKNKTPSASTGESKGIPESTGGKEREHDLSALSKEISTSLNSMRSELRNRLGSINTRLKNVEQAKSVHDKQSKSLSITKTGTIDLRQGAQEPPPETIDITDEEGSIEVISLTHDEILQ